MWLCLPVPRFPLYVLIRGPNLLNQFWVRDVGLGRWSTTRLSGRPEPKQVSTRWLHGPAPEAAALTAGGSPPGLGILPSIMMDAAVDRSSGLVAFWYCLVLRGFDRVDRQPRSRQQSQHSPLGRECMVSGLSCCSRAAETGRWLGLMALPSDGDHIDIDVEMASSARISEMITPMGGPLGLGFAGRASMYFDVLQVFQVVPWLYRPSFAHGPGGNLEVTRAVLVTTRMELDGRIPTLLEGRLGRE